VEQGENGGELYSQVGVVKVHNSGVRVWDNLVEDCPELDIALGVREVFNFDDNNE